MHMFLNIHLFIFFLFKHFNFNGYARNISSIPQQSNIGEYFLEILAFSVSRSEPRNKSVLIYGLELNGAGRHWYCLCGVGSIVWHSSLKVLALCHDRDIVFPDELTSSWGVESTGYAFRVVSELVVSGPSVGVTQHSVRLCYVLELLLCFRVVLESTTSH